MNDASGFYFTKSEVLHFPTLPYVSWKRDDSPREPACSPMNFISATTKVENDDGEVAEIYGVERASPQVEGVGSFAWRSKYVLLMESYFAATKRTILSCTVNVFDYSTIKYGDMRGWYEGRVVEAWADSYRIPFCYSDGEFLFEIFSKGDSITISELEGLSKLPVWAGNEYRLEKERFKRYFGIGG